MKISKIPQFKDIFDKLILPEWLNGKEASGKYLERDNGDLPVLLETCRCFQSLYDAICSARFNLSCACRPEYPELLDPNNPQKAHMWMRSQFVNNAILWYSSIFELLLQPLWIYFKIYEKAKPGLKMTTNDFDKVLEICRFEKIEKYGSFDVGDDLIAELKEIDSNIQDDIRPWANTLKHRKMIEYEELSENDHRINIGHIFSIKRDENGKTIIKCREGDYNSSKTIKLINMSGVINRLIAFHKEIIPVTQEINTLINI